MPDLDFEKTTTSPHVLQFMADYTFTRQKLIAEGVEPLMDTGIGNADLALSIVNDAYTHERMSKNMDRASGTVERVMGVIDDNT